MSVDKKLNKKMEKNLKAWQRRQLYWTRCFPGPGPCSYGLPTTVGHVGHDPSKYRSPSYSFGHGPAAGLGDVRAETRGGPFCPGPTTRRMPSTAWSFGSCPPVLPRRTRRAASGATMLAPSGSSASREPRGAGGSRGAGGTRGARGALGAGGALGGRGALIAGGAKGARRQRLLSRPSALTTNY